MDFLQLTLYRDIFRRAVWQTEQGELPVSVREWLCYTDSLTQKLQQTCEQFTVETIQAEWQAVDLCLEFAKNQVEPTAWVREVVLKCDNVPAIFAQTLLPETTINRVARDVLTLGDHPIGLWLFPQHPQRIRLEWAFDRETNLYARRSYFMLHGYPLTIYELFLPAFSFK